MLSLGGLKYSVSFINVLGFIQLRGVAVFKPNCLKFICLGDHSILIRDVTDITDKLEVTLLVREPYDLEDCCNLSRDQECKFCMDLLQMFLTDYSSNWESFCLHVRDFRMQFRPYL